MSSFLLVLAAPIIGTLGQMFLKIGMREVGEVTFFELRYNTFTILLTMLSNPWIIIAIPLYVGGFILWLIILSKFNLSFAYPFLALSFIMVPLAATMIIGENISMMRWAGIIVIFFGVVIIGFSK